MANTSLRKKAIDEHTVELGKRVGVWRGIVDRETKKVTFVDAEHQRRYDILLMSKEVLEQVTDAEYNLFYERRERAKNPPVQENLFT